MNTIKFSVKDRIATIVLNRPEALNAITHELAHELYDVLIQVEKDDDILAAILTGAGEKAFCTGSDLKLTPPPPEHWAVSKFGNYPKEDFNHLHPRLWYDLPEKFMKLEKPLICAVNGYALGGGLEFALICDIRICSENARFGLPEIKIGSIPGFGGTQRLPRVIARSDAMLMLLTGDHIDAQEAHRIGLVSKVVPQADLLKEANNIAQRIIANAPMSIRVVKQIVRTGLEMPLEAALAQEFTLWGQLRGTEDYKEGRKAFQEKRKPVYHSR